jgi:hypothetical protein
MWNIWKKSLLVSLILSFNVANVKAEEIKGLVVDEDHDALYGATVGLLALPDSTLVDVRMADNFGQFKFTVDRYQDNAFLLVTTMVGYDKVEQVAQSSENYIIMHNNSSELSEVTVVNRKAVLEPIARGYSYKPYGMDYQMPDVMSVLSIAPLLEVTPEGQVSILGVGNALIYINGFLPMEPQTTVVAYLKSLKPDRIKKIDIITNPGAQLGSSYQGGIVDVYLKSQDDGVLTSLTANEYLSSPRVSSSEGVYVGYKSGKFRLSSSLNYRGSNNYNYSENSYDYWTLNKHTENSVRSSGYYNDVTPSVTGAYSINNKSQLTLGVSLKVSESHNHSVSKTISEANGITTESYSKIRTTLPLQIPGYGVGANYRLYSGSRGSYFNVLANYYNNDNHTNRGMDFTGDITNEISYYKGHGYGVTASRYQTFGMTRILQFNVNYKSTTTDSELSSTDVAATNRFIYDESILGVGCDYMDFAIANLFMSAGVSAEYTWSKGHQLVGDEIFHNNYFSITPNFSISYSPNNFFNSLSLDFYTSISRPFFNRLNPFKVWTSDNTYSQGNINLRQEHGYMLTLSCVFLKDHMIKTYGGYHTPSGASVYIPNGDNMMFQLVQYGHNWYYSALYTYNKDIIPSIWRIKGEAQAVYDNTTGSAYGYNITSVNWHWYASLKNTVTIWPQQKLICIVGYDYLSPMKFATRYGKYRHLLSIELNKSFDCGLSVAFRAGNILNQKGGDPMDYYDSAEYSYKLNRKNTFRDFNINISYTFGNRRTNSPQDISKSNIDRSN